MDFNGCIVENNWLMIDLQILHLGIIPLSLVDKEALQQSLQMISPHDKAYGSLFYKLKGL